MHIVVVISSYYGNSGISTNAQGLLFNLIRNGHRITILAPDVIPENNNKYLHFIRIPDIRYIPQVLFYLIKIYEVHWKDPIDVIQIYDSIAFITVVVFSKLCKVPIVFSVQASIFSKGRKIDYPWISTQIYKFTNRFVAWCADKLICISQEMVDCMLYAGADRKRIIVIPNPVAITLINNREKKNGKSKALLYVGALRPTKGVEYLIYAVPKILKYIPDLKVTIVGDGPNSKVFEMLVQKLGIQDIIHFVGFVKREDIFSYYYQADLFMMPSLNEPQGIVALEAMASGLPVVASEVGGIPEMIEDGYNGFLVPPKNVEALVEKSVCLLRDNQLRKQFSLNALRKVQEFSWKKNIDKYICLFESLTTNYKVR